MGQGTIFVTSTVTHCNGSLYGCCLPQSYSTSRSTYFLAGLDLNEELLVIKEVSIYQSKLHIDTKKNF